MSALQIVNPNAELARKEQANAINFAAARGISDVLKSNLGPKGTYKMLVSGAGEIKITKDGAVLLHEMQIQHPTASLIARTATAQDDVTGDGTTSIVCLIGALMNQAQRYMSEGVHPSVMVEGYELAKTETLAFLEKFKMVKDTQNDKELLINVARTSLRTKLSPHLADQLADIIVDALMTIKKPNQEIDLFMVEIMHMQHRTEDDTRLIKGLVMDHGARHPDMKKRLTNCFILTCNVSLEYEKSEINSSFMYETAEQRQQLVNAERKLCDDKIRAIIALKRKVCDTPDKSFVVINQKGIDPMSLDMLAKEGILALRRAKRRNMERLTLACGGEAINSVEDLRPEVLGFAEEVYEQTLGEEKYTFVEGVKNPLSVTILIKGPNKHTIAQIKDAVRDGLRAVKNALDDGSVVPGAGAFEVACSEHLEGYAKTVTGKAKLGVQAYAAALLAIPKILAENSGFDTQDVILQVRDAVKSGLVAGLDVFSQSGEPCLPAELGIFDNYKVKKHIINACTFTATQLLYVDEILKAGKATQKMEQ